MKKNIVILDIVIIMLYIGAICTFVPKVLAHTFSVASLVITMLCGIMIGLCTCDLVDELRQFNSDDEDEE